MKYRVEIYNGTGQLLADVSDFATSKKIQKKRNRADVISVNFDVNKAKEMSKRIGMQFWDLFALNVNEIRIYRNDTVLTAGQLAYGRPQMTGGRGMVEFKAIGWLDLFAKRFTPQNVRYDNTDGGLIAWNIIDASQQLENGNFGIQQGTIQTSVPRDRSYSDKNIRDAIIELSEVINGFDFEITWNKFFNVYYPKIGSRRTDIAFTYPGNIIDIAFERDGMKLANEIIAKGAGFGDDVIRTTAEDETSRGVYKLRQDIISYNDISRLETLQEHADGERDVKKYYRDVPDIIVDGSVEPQLLNYNIGDEIKVVTEEQDIFKPVNDYFRIDAMDIDINENNKETVRIRLAK